MAMLGASSSSLLQNALVLVRKTIGAAVLPHVELSLKCLLQVLKTPVSRDMLGRVFNGSGKPIDGG